MRVIGGEARGRRLGAPRGMRTRPTADRVRQSLFDILGQRCDGLMVLDLFAGSGALGIEALSRGARSCVFFEIEKAAIAALVDNIERLGYSHRASIRRQDVLSAGFNGLGPFDLVLADPPYDLGATSTLNRLSQVASVLLVPGARIVLEHSRREEIPNQIGALRKADERRFGDTMLTFCTNDEERS